MTYDLKEVIIQPESLDLPLLLDEPVQTAPTCSISAEKAYYVIAFQVALLIGLVIFVVVLGVKLLD